MKLTRPLGVRLFLLLLAVMIIFFTVHTYIVIRVQRQHLMQSVILNAQSLSDVIKRSTRYGMLLNRSVDVHETIKMIGGEPGIEGIRILNKKGKIMFSTVAGEEEHTVDMRAEACYACHNRTEPLRSLPIRNRSRIFPSGDGHRVLGLINPIRNEPECMNSSCHAHPASKTVLGVLDVKMSLEQVDRQLASSRRQLIASSAVMTLIVALVSGIFIWILVRLPVQRLIKGTREVAGGNLEYAIPVNSRDEIGQLADSFNKMTSDLRTARDEITNWSQTLEERVKQKAQELKQIQEHMVQVEKMASLGKLSATVAHEINNPLAGILTYIKLIIRQLQKEDLTPEKKPWLENYLSLIQTEVTRCGDIVKNLLLFAKHTGGEPSLQNLGEIVEKSLFLVSHHLEIHGIRLEHVPVEMDDKILCEPDQLRQAFLAVLVNASEAMPDGGTLRVAVAPGGTGKDFQVRISDTGIGIPKEQISRIFEPFFTTKTDANSVGLGLSVAYGIIQRHGGEIKVESEIGRGTTFIITIPRSYSRPLETGNTDNGTGGI